MTEVRFDGKVVAVTGAGRGLGAAYARLLAERGASVVVNDLGTKMDGGGSSTEAADRLVAEIRREGGKAVANYSDIADPAQAGAIVADAVAGFGRLDALINNAGIISTNSFPELTTDLLQRQLNVHLFGALNVTQAAWPALVESRGAVVFTVSAGMLGSRHTVAYNVAKASVLGLMRSVACEGAAAGVRVNAVMPGAETRMQGTALDADSAENSARRTTDVNSAANAAPLACFLAHESCRANGEVFATGRGHMAKILLASSEGVSERDPSLESVAAGFERIRSLTELREETDLRTYRDRLIEVWN
ncbi:SDR family NAD(P)-dependent oxidoreductase [Amycolatopsis sp.]|uniref:SDR family NAD(P)-dependent oxidoreductase n=1 Tax=Amycolatopsis sp. TaxID=37632 RepID=UPI002C1CF127|nr:SDR family NAD(P)-dependent oxidoreductase [Amycolatopsis sp.]HVV10467.1 SDR family NAD(P)-dependent oxidoreductase [Amycolatopsis sp.]